MVRQASARRSPVFCRTVFNVTMSLCRPGKASAKTAQPERAALWARPVARDRCAHRRPIDSFFAFSLSFRRELGEIEAALRNQPTGERREADAVRPLRGPKPVGWRRHFLEGRAPLRGLRRRALRAGAFASRHRRRPRPLRRPSRSPRPDTDFGQPPATIACTSIVTLSVSTSNRLSPSLISSPTDLNQARILPSATVSPSWGMMIVEAIGLPVQHAPHLVGDALRARQRQILEMIGGRQRYVRRGDADDRAVQIPEGFVRDDRRDLRAPTAEPRILFHREQRPVFATEPRIVCVSSGTSERRSITSASMPCSFASVSAASKAREGP